MTTITVTIDDRLVETARRVAAGEHTTLEAKVRQWLEGYAEKEERKKSPEEEAEERRRQAERSRASIEALSKVVRLRGHKFTREEMNARGRPKYGEAGAEERRRQAEAGKTARTGGEE